jgi:uncharacterized membrane protein
VLLLLGVLFTGMLLLLGLVTGGDSVTGALLGVFGLLVGVCPVGVGTPLNFDIKLTFCMPFTTWTNNRSLTKHYSKIFLRT